MLWQKLFILGLLAVVVVALPFGIYCYKMQEDIATVTREIEGINPAITLQKMLQLIQQHRDLSAIALVDHKASSKAAREQVVKKIVMVIDDMDHIIKGRVQQKTLI